MTFRQTDRETERESVCVCVSETFRQTDRETERERECVCVSE